MDRRQEIERSIIKKYRHTIWNRFIGGMKDYHLIEEGDTIGVCISGGKDSMLLAKCMQELQRHSYLKFELKFLVMDPGYNQKNRLRIEENLALLGIPATFFTTDIFDVVNTITEKPCYLCARMRRGYLYQFAQSLGCNKIALGHHFDDMIETVVMSMFYSAEIKTMMPKLRSKNFAGMELIRPLYLVREQDILAWARYNDLHFLQCACRRTENLAPGEEHDGGRRSATKALLRRLRAENPQIDINIFRSVHDVNLKTLIGYTDLAGKHHNFLDAYEGRLRRPEFAVFDLDGTLLDSMHVWDPVSAAYLRLHGHTPPPQLDSWVRGMNVREAVQFLNKTYGLDVPVQQGVQEVCDMVAKAYAETVQAKPFVREYLEQLHRHGVPMCVATSSELPVVLPALRRLGLDGYFKFVLTAGTLGASKQSPEFYHKVAQQFETTANHLTVYEDALHAIESAKAAGCRVIALYDEAGAQERSRIKVICDYYAGGFDTLLED
jgi:HAD superfamily hydrolase (TIGR01509 family)